MLELSTAALTGTERGPLLAAATGLVRRALGAEACAVFDGPPGGPARPPVAMDGPAWAATSLNSSGPWTVPIGVGAAFGCLAAMGGRQPRWGTEDRQFLTDMTDLLAAALGRLGEEERRRRAVLEDPLTGLANRTLIFDHLSLALARGERHHSPVGVLFVDLDRFKSINDTLGHAAGDEVLQGVAGRLREALRPSDTVGRLGGDEFVVVCEDVAGSAEALAVAERVTAAFEAPVAVGGGGAPIGLSIGVALSSFDRPMDPALLLAEADAAMYAAKQRKNHSAVLFREEMRPRAEALVASGELFHGSGAMRQRTDGFVDLTMFDSQ
jgi:diguanylate cyclase (GGDEF)-like protein